MNELIKLLESVLGRATKSSGTNYRFHCPFCNHHKPKLEINPDGQWYHCWVCNTRGKYILTLFRKLQVDSSKYQELARILDDEDWQYRPKQTSTGTSIVKLPDEYKPLWVKSKSPEYRNAISYLNTRNITTQDILRYRIGYCTSGYYSNKLIIPSYDENGSLNFFVSRAYYEADTMKYINPTISKDVIGFELFINWNEPIILVEGVFDAIAVKRNAIPLFGKDISKTLQKRIVLKHVEEIYIYLDSDARAAALDTAEYFINNGIHVYLVDPEDSDPSDLGFSKNLHILRATTEITSENIMAEKIKWSLNLSNPI